jgi:hypothetical protein
MPAAKEAVPAAKKAAAPAKAAAEATITLKHLAATLADSHVRWSHPAGQFGGLDKLGSGCH